MSANSVIAVKPGSHIAIHVPFNDHSKKRIIKLYDRRQFQFSQPDVFVSQLVMYARSCNGYPDFLIRLHVIQPSISCVCYAIHSIQTCCCFPVPDLIISNKLNLTLQTGHKLLTQLGSCFLICVPCLFLSVNLEFFALWHCSCIFTNFFTQTFVLFQLCRNNHMMGDGWSKDITSSLGQMLGIQSWVLLLPKFKSLCGLIASILQWGRCR